MNHLWRDGTLHSQKIFLYTVFWVWLLRTWVGSNRQLVNLVIKEFVDCNQQVDERNDWGGSATQSQEYSHVGFCWNHRLVKTWHILWCNFPFVLVLVLMLCFGWLWLWKHHGLALNVYSGCHTHGWRLSDLLRKTGLLVSAKNVGNVCSSPWEKKKRVFDTI